MTALYQAAKRFILEKRFAVISGVEARGQKA